jgi:hypothetical protein
MGRIVVNPAHLTNAAKGLREVVEPEARKAAERLAGEYRIDPPGFGIALSAIEADYNATLDYHLQNLRAAAESIEAVARGLEITVGNYERAEQVNVDMMSVAGVSDGKGWAGGLADTGMVRTVTSPLGGDGLQLHDVDTIVAIGAELAVLTLAGFTAWMAPTYLPAPIVAASIIADGPSMITVSRRLGAIASTLENGVAKQFDSYANGATAGWEDASVVEYRKVVTEIGRELSQMQKALSTAASLVAAIAALLGAFWLAFISFSGPFFVTISELFAASIGPQAPIVQPIIQGLGALGSAAWLKATGTVITVGAAAGMLLLGVVKEWSAFQRFDEQGDHTPDLKQIRISWHSA